MDSIEKYKPTTSVIEAFDVNESLPDNELTFEIFKSLVKARQIQDILFLAIGRMLKIVRDRKLYKYLDYETFSQFLDSDEMSFSREKAYMYIRIWEYYCEYLELPEDAIRDISIARLSLLLPALKTIPTKEEQIAEIEKARHMPYSDFVRNVKNRSAGEKPVVYFSKEIGKWIVYYFEDKTHLINKGIYGQNTEPQEGS